MRCSLNSCIAIIMYVKLIALKHDLCVGNLVTVSYRLVYNKHGIKFLFSHVCLEPVRLQLTYENCDALQNIEERQTSISL